MLPTIYTPATLAAFMRDSLKTFATDLGWSSEASYTEPITSVLLAYGVTSLSDATDIARVRALAKIEAWRAAAEATAGDYDVVNQVDGNKRSQAHAQAKAMLKLAKDEYRELLDERAKAALTPVASYGSQAAEVIVGW